MNILVTGAGGQLGLCLRDVVELTGNGKPDHFVGEPNYYIFKNHDELDITDELAVANFVRENHICVIVNCAAYTNVNKAQEDRDNAYNVNALGALNLALAAKENGAVLIHISTDYVHNHMHVTPIKAGSLFDFDIVDREQCFYGFSKAMGEDLIENSFCKAIIIRTSWLCSEYGKNFVKTMFERARKGEPSQVVIDQTGCITDARDLAQFIHRIIENNASTSPYLSRCGVYNFASDGVCTWYDVAREVYRQSCGENEAMLVTKRLTEPDEPVKRPPYSVLDLSETERTFDYKPTYWADAITHILDRIEEK